MTKILFSILFAASITCPAFAEDAKKPAGPTHEQREKLAEAHEKMASCLRSERPMPECRDEMMKSRKDILGTDDFPMMGGKHGRGMRRRMHSGDNE